MYRPECPKNASCFSLFWILFRAHCQEQLHLDHNWSLIELEWQGTFFALRWYWAPNHMYYPRYQAISNVVWKYRKEMISMAIREKPLFKVFVTGGHPQSALWGNTKSTLPWMVLAPYTRISGMGYAEMVFDRGVVWWSLEHEGKFHVEENWEPGPGVGGSSGEWCKIATG